MTQRDKWAKRPSVLRYRRFKDQVRLRRVALPQPCSVVFWMPMPPSWPLARRLAHAGQPHRVRPDLDNLLKALCDAVHQEDAHLYDIRAEKRWAGNGKGCIEVAPADPHEHPCQPVSAPAKLTKRLRRPRLGA
jgi:Holliday junction resolvase RusA-like endonuclease